MERGIIGVVSGKGGVGKTTTVLNLSAALMGFNKNVIAIDTDIKMTGLGLQLGMYYFPVTLNDILMGRGKLFEALYIHSSGLRVIPASLYMEDVKIHRFKEVLKDPFLEGYTVLVDAPPGLENNAKAILKACPELLIVTTPELPSVTDAMKIITLTEKMKSKPIGIILNMVKKGSDEIKKEEIESACGVPVLGEVPYDENIRKSIFHGTPGVLLDPYSPSSIAYKQIAAILIEENYEPPRFNRLKRLFRRFRR